MAFAQTNSWFTEKKGTAMSQTIERLTNVFQRVFESSDLSVDRDTTAADIVEWDSLMHVTLMVNVEQEFGVRFSSSEVARLKNVGELLDLVESRQVAS